MFPADGINAQQTQPLPQRSSSVPFIDPNHIPNDNTHSYTQDAQQQQNQSYFHPTLVDAAYNGVSVPITIDNGVAQGPLGQSPAPLPNSYPQPEYAALQQNYPNQQYIQDPQDSLFTQPSLSPTGDFLTVYDLLAPPPLQMLIQPFILEGYSDMAFITSLDERQIQHMFFRVSQRAQALGVVFTPQHADAVAGRITQERQRRINRIQQTYQASIMPTQARAGPGGVPKSSGPSQRALICAMCGCTARSWVCFVISAIVCVVLGSVLLAMYLTLGRNAPEGSEGAWSFVLVLLVLLYVVAGIALLAAVASYCTLGAGAGLCDDCCVDDGSPGICDGLCTNVSCCPTEPCCAGACCAGACTGVCANTCCADFSCKLCDDCDCPSCSDCCPALDCSCPSCDCDCCPDCSSPCRDCCMCCEQCDLRPPTCDCSCCPNVTETGCWLACYKIVCCQCKIQLA